jgi:hypothetical protein
MAASLPELPGNASLPDPERSIGADAANAAFKQLAANQLAAKGPTPAPTPTTNGPAFNLDLSNLQKGNANLKPSSILKKVATKAKTSKKKQEKTTEEQKQKKKRRAETSKCKLLRDVRAHAGKLEQYKARVIDQVTSTPAGDITFGVPLPGDLLATAGCLLEKLLIPSELATSKVLKTKVLALWAYMHFEIICFEDKDKAKWATRVNKTLLVLAKNVGTSSVDGDTNYYNFLLVDEKKFKELGLELAVCKGQTRSPSPKCPTPKPGALTPSETQHPLSSEATPSMSPGRTPGAPTLSPRTPKGLSRTTQPKGRSHTSALVLNFKDLSTDFHKIFISVPLFNHKEPLTYEVVIYMTEENTRVCGSIVYNRRLWLTAGDGGGAGADVPAEKYQKHPHLSGPQTLNFNVLLDGAAKGELTVSLLPDGLLCTVLKAKDHPTPVVTQAKAKAKAKANPHTHTHTHTHIHTFTHTHTHTHTHTYSQSLQVVWVIVTSVLTGLLGRDRPSPLLTRCASACVSRLQRPLPLPD